MMQEQKKLNMKHQRFQETYDKRNICEVMKEKNPGCSQSKEHSKERNQQCPELALVKKGP